jgi:hypothetical protein
MMKRLLQRLGLAGRIGLAALLVAACGGGVETGGTGPTGSAYVEGPITGFGSIIVGGVRFDESSARIDDADGRGSDALRLGVRVEVESGPIATDGSGARSATATRVRIASDLVGPVTQVSAGGGLIQVLGQTVVVTAATVVDGVAGGSAALVVGDIVEVHGFVRPDAVFDGYVATRIEKRSGAVASFRVRGVVRDLAGTTLRVGSQPFDLGATAPPSGLANGVFVRMTVGTQQVNGRWPVSAIAIESRRVDDRDEAEVEGVITALTSVTRFAVNGIDVDASNATFEPGTGGVLLGTRVKVRGASSGGVLVARSVELRGDDDPFNNDGIDLRGEISGFDAAARVFSVRGVTVFYGTVPAPRYDNGSESDLANGRRVRVRAQLSADRTRVEATRIEFVSN